MRHMLPHDMKNFRAPLLDHIADDPLPWLLVAAIIIAAVL